MVFTVRHAAIACAGVAAVLASPAASYADDAPAAAPALHGVTVTRSLEPNGAIVVEQWSDRGPEERASAHAGSGATLLVSGVVTFGLSYIPAVTTASDSRIAVDKQLLVPFVGPWIDLANRPNCGAGGAACTTEPRNQGLLIVDGFFQGLALVQVLAGVAALSHDTTSPVAKIDEKPTVRVRPTQVGSGGYGLAAIGRF